MRVDVDLILPGFPGKLSIADLGWCSVAILRSGNETLLLDTGGPGARRVILDELNKRKISFKDIDKVFITHMHWDHCYNADLFPHSEFVISAAEWEFGNLTASVEPREAPAFQGGYLPWLRSFRKRLIKEDGEEIISGVTALFTPGHTPGSTSLVLEQGEEKWILAGDSVKNRVELSTGNVDMSMNLSESKNSIDKIKNIAKRVLPGHDCWLRVENGAVVPDGNNDVTLTMPQGLKINWEEKLTLHVS